jgi:hypothetical protein
MVGSRYECRQRVRATAWRRNKEYCGFEGPKAPEIISAIAKPGKLARTLGIAAQAGAIMIGITLSSEQIRRAPPEVRLWLEHEVATSLGLQVQAADSRRQAPQLAACSHDELAAVLSLIQGVFPAVNVFFELGRKGTAFAQDRLQAYRVSDIQHHTRLQTPDQVLSCLNLINDALQRTRGSAGASFFGTDGDYCFIAAETQENIRRLWFELIGRGEVTASPAAASNGPAPAEPGPANDRPAAASAGAGM